MSTFQQSAHESGVSSKNIAIIGGGLAGLLCATALAQKNAKVTVFEKRSREAASGGNARSFSLTLSSRGYLALKEFGLWGEIKPITMPVSGRMCHSDMELQPFEYSADGTLVLHAVRRSKINEKLLAATERFPEVTIKFDHSLVAIDEPTGTVAMHDAEGDAIMYDGFDLIIGADGAHSQTRKLIQQGQAVSTTESYLDWGYRELQLPKGTAQSEGDGMDPGYLHLWPRKDMMMFALPNDDQTFGANFIFPLNEEETIFDPTNLTAFLEKQFPDLASLAPLLAHDLMGKKTSHFFSQRSSMWHTNDRIVLIGDAAHSTVPFYGQGMNCAFEGVSNLVSRLDREWNDKPLATILSEYQAERKPHTDKIADLSVENFDELRRDFGKLGPQAERMAQVIFHKLAPKLFTPLHIQISHGELGYKDAEDLYFRQRRVAKWLGLDIIKIACSWWISNVGYYQRFPETILTLR